MVVLEDADHFLMEDQPDRVAAEISAFLAGVTSTAATGG
jgi:pimeloyl-ACP methyl ester carboxylesterase